MTAAIGGLRGDMNTTIGELRTAMSHQFYWLIGVQIAVLAVVVAIVGLAG